MLYPFILLLCNIIRKSAQKLVNVNICWYCVSSSSISTFNNKTTLSHPMPNLVQDLFIYSFISEPSPIVDVAMKPLHLSFCLRAFKLLNQSPPSRHPTRIIIKSYFLENLRPLPANKRQHNTGFIPSRMEYIKMAFFCSILLTYILYYIITYIYFVEP